MNIPNPVVGNPINTRRLQDANYVSAPVAPPAAGGASATASFDLTQTSPWPVTERVLATATFTGTSTVSSTGTIGMRWQDSADNATFTNIAEMGEYDLTASVNPLLTNQFSAGTNVVDQWQFPPTVRRYVRLALTTSSANASAGSGLAIAALYF